MRRKIPHELEQMDESTWRYKVYGGWIVKTIHKEGKLCAISTVFILDREHEWHIQREAPKNDLS